MNRLLTVMAVVFASAVAFGAPSWASVSSAAYDEKDTSPSQANSTAYSGYLCTVAAAQSAFKASTIQGVTDYFVQNFSAGSSALATLSSGSVGAKLSGGATALDAVEYDENGEQYSFTTYFASSSENLVADSTYLAILLYASGDNYAVRVFSAQTSSTPTWRADDGTARPAGSAGEWVAAIPEPTSGLLFLLGLSGLALKRKRHPSI